MRRDSERSEINRLWGRSQERPPEQDATAAPLVPSETRRSGNERAYLAYEVQEHARRLHISCASQPSRYPAYSSLLDIIHDRHFDRAFTLVYSFMLVEVTGSHLVGIVHAISSGNCGCIREFHTKLHDRPALNEPVIDSITITAAAAGSQRA